MRTVHNFGRNGKIKVDVQMYVREIRGEDLLCVVHQQVERVPETSESAVRFPIWQKVLQPHRWTHRTSCLMEMWCLDTGVNTAAFSRDCTALIKSISTRWGGD